MPWEIGSGPLTEIHTRFVHRLEAGAGLDFTDRPKANIHLGQLQQM